MTEILTGQERAIADQLSRRAKQGKPARGSSARTDIVSDTVFEDSQGNRVREMQTIPGGAYARPLWNLNIPQSVKETGARFAALFEQAERGGTAQAIDASRISVDGGRYKSHSPPIEAVQLVKAAREALGTAPPVFEARVIGGVRVPAMTAFALVYGICVQELPLGSIIRVCGRNATSGRNMTQCKDSLCDALGRVSEAWASMRVG